MEKSRIKKWSLLDMVRLYSRGVKMTLKVGLVPMETTKLHVRSFVCHMYLNLNPGQALK